MTSTSTHTSSSTTTTTTAEHASSNETSHVISASALSQLVADDPAVRLIDVRTPGEFATRHIAGSYNVPLVTLGEHARDLAAVEHPVVLVCQTGGRAQQAHTTLRAAGKQHLILLEGGIEGWAIGGHDVVHGTSDKWAMDRQVRGAAGSVVLLGIVLSIKFPRMKWLAGAVGSGLTFSAISNTCAMGNALGRLPYNRGDNCDIELILDALDSGAAA